MNAHKKKELKITTTTSSTTSDGQRTKKGAIDKKGRKGETDFVEIGRRHGRKRGEVKIKGRSVADLIIENALMGTNGDELQMEDFGKKPDLWMVAFDNPVDFIQFCRKRMDHERELLDRSRKTEAEIVELVQRWTESTNKHALVLDDLCKTQNHNDKLQEVIMEERTNCQHLVGENFQLEADKKLLSRKYQASLMLGKVNDKSVKHLLERNPKAVPLTDKMSDLEEKIRKCDVKFKGGGDCADPYVLAEKVDRLESYIETLKKQHLEEVTVLKDSIAKYDLKYDSLKLHYRDALQRNTHAFEEVRQVLAISMHENLELRQELLKKDETFLLSHLEGIEKTKLKHRPRPQITKNILELEESIDKSFEVLRDEAEEKTEKDLRLKLSRMEIEVEEKAGILRDALSKLMVLERTCSRLKEENEVMKKSHQHSQKALRERNQVLQKRCENMDERRKLDNNGFREDVRELKFLMKTLQKNVTKCTRVYGDLEAAEEQPVAADDDMEAIIDKQRSLERYKMFLQKTDPKLIQQAMSSWTNYLDKKLDDLELKVHFNKYRDDD